MYLVCGGKFLYPKKEVNFVKYGMKNIIAKARLINNVCGVAQDKLIFSFGENLRKQIVITIDKDGKSSIKKGRR